MQPEIDAAMVARLGRLKDEDYRELSRLCGTILEQDLAE